MSNRGIIHVTPLLSGSLGRILDECFSEGQTVRHQMTSIEGEILHVYSDGSRLLNMEDGTQKHDNPWEVAHVKRWPFLSEGIGGNMKRVRVEVEVTRRTSIEFEVEDDADNEEIKETALDEAELAEWDEDPPEVVSIAIIDPSQ